MDGFGNARTAQLLVWFSREINHMQAPAGVSLSSQMLFSAQRSHSFTYRTYYGDT